MVLPPPPERGPRPDMPVESDPVRLCPELSRPMMVGGGGFPPPSGHMLVGGTGGVPPAMQVTGGGVPREMRVGGWSAEQEVTDQVRDILEKVRVVISWQDYGAVE